MPLPLSIDDVEYDNLWTGDLIVTDRTIYFFAHEKSEKESERFHSILLLGDHFGWIGAVLGVIANFVTAERRTTNNSRLHKTGLLRQFDSNAELQSRLDGYIRVLTQHQEPMEFSAGLLTPIRIPSEDVRDVRIDFRSRLLIETAYDKHAFDVGLKRKKLLRGALHEGQFCSRRITNPSVDLQRTTLR